MFNNSNWTGRAPRTQEQAFGPYSKRLVSEYRTQPEYYVVIVGAVLFTALSATAFYLIGL